MFSLSGVLRIVLTLIRIRSRSEVLSSLLCVFSWSGVQPLAGSNT